MSKAERQRRWRERKKQRDYSNALHAEANVSGTRSDDDPEDAAEMLRWVAGALSHEPAKDSEADPVSEKDAPSPQAWALYRACRKDPAQARQFWTNFMAFLKASTAPKQESQAKVDDRRRMFKLFDALRRERPDLIEKKAQYEQEQAADDERRGAAARLGSGQRPAQNEVPEKSVPSVPGISSQAGELAAPGGIDVELIGTDGLEVGNVETGPTPRRAA